MGGGALTVRLKPDRILLQSFEISAGEIAHLREVAAQVGRLRAEPKVWAFITGQIGHGADYTDEYRIVDSKEEWVRLQSPGGGGGHFRPEQVRAFGDLRWPVRPLSAVHPRPIDPRPPRHHNSQVPAPRRGPPTAARQLAHAET
jgi:hypothetical protein